MAEETIQYFNSVEAARILGVNVSTIKRWTDSGELACIRTPGGHRKFLPEHLNEFMEKHRSKKTRLPLLSIEEAADVEITAHVFRDDLPFLQEYLLEQALSGYIERILLLFSAMISKPKPLHEIYDKLVTPVMHRLGELWEAEKLSVVEEHLASQTIRLAQDRLQAIIAIPREKIGTVLCMNLSNELHDIPLQMVGHLLEKRGFRVMFCGQMTPYLGLEEILARLSIDRLYISSTIVQDPVSTRREFQQIYRTVTEKGIQIFIGGQGVDRLRMEPPEGVTRLMTFREVAEE